MHGGDRRNFTVATSNNSILTLLALLIIPDVRRCFQNLIYHTTWLSHTAVFAKPNPLPNANEQKKFRHQISVRKKNTLLYLCGIEYLCITLNSRAGTIWLRRRRNPNVSKEDVTDPARDQRKIYLRVNLKRKIQLQTVSASPYPRWWNPRRGPRSFT